MGNSCQSDANKAEVNTEVSNVMGSPMPGAMGQVASPSVLPGFEQPAALQSRPADHNSVVHQHDVVHDLPCGSASFPLAMPFNSSPVIQGVDEYGMGHVQPAEFFQAQVCEGPHCPQPTHVEIHPGAYKNIATGEIIYAADYSGHQTGEEAIVRKSGGEVVRLSTASRAHVAEAVRMSGGSRRPPSHNGSVQQGSNNLIVAAAMEVEEPKKEEDEEEPAEPKEEAPKKKKKRRRMFRRKRNRGGDVSDY